MRKLSLIGAVAALSIIGAATAPAMTALAESTTARPKMNDSANDAALRYQDGIRYLQAGQYKQAERAFKDVLEVSTRDATASYLMAMTQVGLNDSKEARKYMRNAVKFNKEFPEAIGWLGALEIQLGDAEAGAKQKTALEALKAKCADTCDKAAVIEEGLARIDQASAKPAASLSPRGSIEQVASLAKGDAAYLAAHGLINEGKYAQGLTALQDAAMAYGPNADVLTYQGFANRKLGNYETAIGFYSMALKMQPDHRGANEYLGEYYVEIGDMAKAKAQLSKLDSICKFGCEEAEELRRWIAAKS